MTDYDYCEGFEKGVLPKPVVWKGDDGTEFQYRAYRIDRKWWPDKPGLFLFVKQSEDGEWLLIQVEETDSFTTSDISNPEKWNCAQEHGATHVHTRVNRDGKRARHKEKMSLVLAGRGPEDDDYPPCN